MSQAVRPIGDHLAAPRGRWHFCPEPLREHFGPRARCQHYAIGFRDVAQVRADAGDARAAAEETGEHRARPQVGAPRLGGKREGAGDLRRVYVELVLGEGSAVHLRRERGLQLA